MSLHWYLFFSRYSVLLPYLFCTWSKPNKPCVWLAKLSYFLYSSQNLGWHKYMQLWDLHESPSVTGLDWTWTLERHLSNTQIRKQLQKDMAKKGSILCLKIKERSPRLEKKRANKAGKMSEIIGYINYLLVHNSNSERSENKLQHKMQ